MRSLTLAVIFAAALPFAASAADEAAAPAADAAAVTVYTKQLTDAATAQSVRRLLQAQGYTSVSDLARDESGRWTGTAVKDGKPLTVSVAMPPKPDDTKSTN